MSTTFKNRQIVIRGRYSWRNMELTDALIVLDLVWLPYEARPRQLATIPALYNPYKSNPNPNSSPTPPNWLHESYHRWLEDKEAKWLIESP